MGRETETETQRDDTERHRGRKRNRKTERGRQRQTESMKLERDVGPQMAVCSFVWQEAGVARRGSIRNSDLDIFQSEIPIIHPSRDAMKATG